MTNSEALNAVAASAAAGPAVAAASAATPVHAQRAEADDERPFEPEKYLAQAKWLLEWHNKRSDALSSRAVTLLGFNGAILALLINAARLEGLPDLHFLKSVIAAIVVALSLSAICCIKAITPNAATVPEVGQLREHWAIDLELRPGTPVDNIGAQVAESFLNGSALAADSPLEVARDDANSRAKWVNRAAEFLLTGLLILGGLVAYLFIRM